MNSSLAKGGPSLVFAAPGGPRLQPDGKRLGKILGGMGLGIPRTEVLHEPPAAGPRTIGVRIRERRRSEHLAPTAAAAHPIGRVDGVPRFVAQDAHQPVAIAALDLAHEAPFDARKALMRQVERHRDAGDAVRREPLLCEPAVGPKADTAGGELVVQPSDRPLELRARDGELQVAETQAQELVVGERLPCIARGRAAPAPPCRRQ